MHLIQRTVHLLHLSLKFAVMFQTWRRAAQWLCITKGTIFTYKHGHTYTHWINTTTKARLPSVLSTRKHLWATYFNLSSLFFFVLQDIFRPHTNIFYHVHVWLQFFFSHLFVHYLKYSSQFPLYLSSQFPLHCKHNLLFPNAGFLQVPGLNRFKGYPRACEKDPVVGHDTRYVCPNTESNVPTKRWVQFPFNQLFQQHQIF